MNKGFLFVISGPSAVGKTSVAENLLQIDSSLSKITTCTTRKIRNGERDGVDYFFMGKNEFLRRKNLGDFVEFSEVYGNFYGILQETLQKSPDEKKSSLLVINWDGFLKVKAKFPQQVIGFFLLPPSIDQLEARIRVRSTDSEEIIQQRLKLSKEDFVHADEFDFQVINDSLEIAVLEVQKIIRKIQAQT